MKLVLARHYKVTNYRNVTHPWTAVVVQWVRWRFPAGGSTGRRSFVIVAMNYSLMTVSDSLLLRRRWLFPRVTGWDPSLAGRSAVRMSWLFFLALLLTDVSAVWWMVYSIRQWLVKSNISRQPSQAKVLTGGRRLAQSASRRPRLLTIPAFDRIAGLYNRHLNSNRGYAYANNLSFGLC
jgi:hypothetical protein